MSDTSNHRTPPGLLRRLAPAAALGGVAVAIVGLLDPALAGRSNSAEAADRSATAATPTPLAPSAPTVSPEMPAPQEPVASAAPESSTAPGSNTASTSPTQPTATCDNAQTVSGPQVDTRWGVVQVAATVANGAVCEVHAVAYPDADHHSSRINAAAIPILDSAASSSGVAFDNVSGATYTSEAYRESLQSILDSL
ncbi:MAG: FMN-binding protein [Candidatus Nanopelagicales bacterium]